MLEFCKKVLVKVSFDRSLFAKELKKSISWLKKDELLHFKQWCIQRFGSTYGDLIQASFA
jgi:hypothetical protein